MEKDSGTARRLIVDVRRANECFQALSGGLLLSPEGLARMEVELPPDAPLGSGRAADLLSDDLLIGLSDVSNCFHGLRVPSQLADCSPPQCLGPRVES